MKARQARELGTQIAVLVHQEQVEAAYALLSPVLAQRPHRAIMLRKALTFLSDKQRVHITRQTSRRGGRQTRRH